MSQLILKKVSDAIQKEMITNKKWHSETLAKAALEALKDLNRQLPNGTLTSEVWHEVIKHF